MLAQPTEDEGVVLERPSETQPTPSPTHPSEDQSKPQPDPFLRPSSSNPIPDSILEGSGGNHGGQSSSDRSQSGTEDDLTVQSVYDLCVFLCKQVTAQAANIKDLKAQIKQLKKKARPVINHHKAWIKSLSMKKRLARKKKMESPNEGTAEPNEEGVNEAEKKFKMLANDEEIARKIRFLLRSFKKKREKSLTLSKEPSFFMIPLLHKEDFLLSLLQQSFYRAIKTTSYKKSAEKPNDDILEVKRANENFIPISYAKDEKLIEKINKKAAGWIKFIEQQLDDFGAKIEEGRIF
ncbi:hypothetical protein Tco_0993539 [Tanacetum coccineum]